MAKLDNGYFIIIEGCDGSGKTTAAKELVNKLNNNGYDAIYTREPGGIPEAEKIREIVLNSTLDARQYTLLFMASMSLNIQRTIKPALKNNKIVICDRFVRSTYIYQGFYNYDPYTKISIEEEDDECNLYSVFTNLVDYATFGLQPDLEFILDTSAEVAWDRINARNKNTDVFEMLGFNHHKDIAEKYINIKDLEVYPNDYTTDVEHINTDYLNPHGVVESIYSKLINYLNIYDGKVPIEQIKEYYDNKYGVSELKTMIDDIHKESNNRNGVV